MRTESGTEMRQRVERAIERAKDTRDTRDLERLLRVDEWTHYDKRLALESNGEEPFELTEHERDAVISWINAAEDGLDEKLVHALFALEHYEPNALLQDIHEDMYGD